MIICLPYSLGAVPARPGEVDGRAGQVYIRNFEGVRDLMSLNNEIIRFDNVRMHYRQGRAVLDGVSFTLTKGSFFFITGPNGAGKSSLLRLISLAYRPSRGHLHLFGREAQTIPWKEVPSFRRKMGIVTQDSALVAHLSVFENVSLPLRIAGVPASRMREQVTEMLGWIGLDSKFNVLPAELSTGERQLVALARAVVNNPGLVLADEPTVNVDPDNTVRFMGLLTELNSLGTTVIVATHSPDLVHRYAYPRLEISAGKVTGPYGARRVANSVV